MKFRLAAASAVVSLAFASAAFAAPPVTAILQTPVEAPKRVAAGGAIWACEGTTCVSGGASNDSAQVPVCRALVRKVGPVTSYASSRRAIEGEDLARCNAVAG